MIGRLKRGLVGALKRMAHAVDEISGGDRLEDLCTCEWCDPSGIRAAMQARAARERAELAEGVPLPCARCGRPAMGRYGGALLCQRCVAGRP